MYAYPSDSHTPQSVTPPTPAYRSQPQPQVPTISYVQDASSGQYESKQPYVTQYYAAAPPTQQVRYFGA